MSFIPTSLPISTPSREAATPSPGLSFGWLARPLLVTAAIPLAAVVDPAWVWAASLLLVGMPHGAYDLAAIHRLTGRRLGRTSAVFGVYTLVMLACVAAFVVAPTATLVAFLVLTAHHFGISDSVATRGGQRHGWFAHASGFARGLAVIAAPFAFQPQLAWAPFAAMGELVGGTVPLNAETVRLTAASLAAVALAVVACQSCVVASRSSPSLAAEELLVPSVVVLVSMVAPPLMVVGVYFVAVHASGHCLRAVDPVAGGGAPTVQRAVGVHRASLALLIPSVAIVLVMAAVWFGGVDVGSVAHAFILFCVFATLPHHLLWLFGIPRRALR